MTFTLCTENDIHLTVCTDCLFQAETGNDMRDDSVPFDRPPLGLLTTDEVRHLVRTLAHPIDFSSAWCQACGTTLAGERHHMVILAVA